MPLSDIVNVQITRETQGVTEAGFGLLNILGTHKQWNDLIRLYNNLNEVLADFDPEMPEFRAAQAVFSQAISPVQLAISRRQVSSVTIDVETALPGYDYTVTINGDAQTRSSTPAVQYSTVVMSGDFVTNNRINVKVNGTIVGTVTSIVKFSSAFLSGQTANPIINGVTLSTVPFDTDNATTLSDLATVMAAAAGVTSATSNGTDTITVVFTSPGNNTVTSCLVTGSGSLPIATISEGAFVYSTSQLVTMTAIVNAIAAMPNIASCVIASSDPTDRTFIVTGDPNFAAVVNFLTVTLGASQATAMITNAPQITTKETIANILASYIQSNSSSLHVNATDNMDGTFTVAGIISTFPFTLSVSTNIPNPDQSRVFVLSAVPGQAYALKIAGTTFTYQAPIDVATEEQIAAALVSLINNAPSDFTCAAVDNLDGSFEVNAKVLGNPYIIQIFTENLEVQFGLIIDPLVASQSVITDLNAIQDVNNSWYALATTSRDSSVVQAIAGWIEPQAKLFGTSSADANIIDEPLGTDTTSIAYLLYNSGYARSFVMYHNDSDTVFPECAWFGNCLPLTPGSETWKFKTLNGIAYSSLDATEVNNALSKNANIYTFIGGRGITQNGTVAVGEFIDVIRGVDWLTSLIQTYVYFTLVNNPKVPYTDAGITAIEAQIRRALQQGIDNNFLTNDPEPTVTVPKAANVSSNDKANRILNGVRFEATLAGAIHVVNITGTVSV